jgi:MOSC domain-containing protein YiiM
MRIDYLSTGQVQTEQLRNRTVTTAGHKQPIAAAHAGPLGLAGDQQADRDNHGGPDKALCVYAFDHYAYWEQVLGRPLAPAAFSENLTVSGLHEAGVHLGDILRAGKALVQVTYPRTPCSKLARKLRRKDLPALIHANGYSGFYLRVLEPGRIAAGDAFEVVTPHPAGVSILDTNRVIFSPTPDPAGINRILEVEEIGYALRYRLERMRVASGD